MKPTGAEIAAEAIQAKGAYTYDQMDCRGFVNYCINACGGSANYAGSNTMARKADYIGTIDVARAQGYLVPGACVMIHEDDRGEPAQYQGDGLGNFSHVGIYVGEDAVRDTDKYGVEHMCNVMHSGKTIGRVAGSTLQSGWTHVVILPDIDIGQVGPTGPILPPGIEENAAIVQTGGGPLNFRISPSKESGRVQGCKQIEEGEAVTVIEVLPGGWSKIGYKAHEGYVMTEFLAHGQTPPQPPQHDGIRITDSTGGVFYPMGEFTIERV